VTFLALGAWVLGYYFFIYIDGAYFSTALGIYVGLFWYDSTSYLIILPCGPDPLNSFSWIPFYWDNFFAKGLTKILPSLEVVEEAPEVWDKVGD
jgi:hypothetical protein